MATVEMNTASTKGDQRRETLSPPEEDSPPVLIDTSAPMDFSELTPHQFGISVQSFTPASLSNRKDKSRLSQIKARRRSSIGVRGSPGTNSLICFRAQQKTPPTIQTPKVAYTLRQKMASFMNVMDVEESEVCDPMPRQDGNTGGCIKTRDYLSDGNSRNGEKENHPPTMTPIPSKRRRLGPPEGCEVEIREASTPTLPLSLKEQEDGVFELQSPSRPPPDGPAAISPARPASSFHIPSFPSLQEMQPTGEDDTVKKKKKSVRFGCPLSPEFFDKNLPPSTPLQKGGTPARAPTPGGSLQLRSALKTPQRSESQTAEAQPNVSTPAAFGASPTLAMPHNRRVQSVGEDGEEKDGKIVFPSMDEIGSAVTSDTECMWDSQPLNLNSAFHEEFLSQSLTESQTKPSTTSKTDALDELTSLPEKEQPLEASVEAPAPAQSRNRRNKQPAPERESTSESPARSRSRKRKQPEECEPVKRSTRTAAKSASGKMKMTSAAARRWNRDVDRSLYGSRAYASKNPNLSPITERLSFFSQCPAEQQAPSTGCTAPNHEAPLNPETTNDTQATGDLAVTLEDPSEDTVPPPTSSKESATGRPSGPRVGGRGLKKRKISVANSILLSEETREKTGGKTEEHCEDQTTADLQASRETPLTHTAPEQGGADTELNAQTPAGTHSDSDGKLQRHDSLDVATSDCPPLGDKSNNTLSPPSEPAEGEAERGRRSCVLQEKGNQAEEHQTSHEVEEKEQGHQAASQQEGDIRPSSDSQEEEGVASLDLAPWQADFNFEDVFKPVATRGQRSVRRSLRNLRNLRKAEHSSDGAGLAWLPRTSPDSSKEARRRGRGRQLTAASTCPASTP